MSFDAEMPRARCVRGADSNKDPLTRALARHVAAAESAESAATPARRWLRQMLEEGAGPAGQGDDTHTEQT
jgi:hypothetical protein